MGMNPEFLDILNYAICEAVNEFCGTQAADFFRKVGEYHLSEALKRDLIKINAADTPLDMLLKIAKYLESEGYMNKIIITKVDENEALIEMLGVSVAKSSIELLGQNKQPSHYMTNIMWAALRKLGIEAELNGLESDKDQCSFREHWKILNP